MALRAFKYNPSLGGFGAESSHASSLGRGDAFPQIVKELVDNAVDACSSCHLDAGRSNKTGLRDREEGRSCEGGVYKRVRVKIEAEEFTTSPIHGGDEEAKTMDCLRITVSDNGVGMEDIDACVMVFSSNKNGANGSGARGDSAKSNYSEKKGNKSKSKKNQTKSKENQNIGDGYTSGRYGLGLTLCLLHAQHLVPGSVTCITSTTAKSTHWIRSTYQVDMDADNVRCKKREELAKESEGECGTIVSLLVPGGQEAQKSWPRLAEYFARYQLSLDLSCSLEVLAPSLCRRPLMIRPPSEIEQRSRMVEVEKVDECDLDGDGWDDGCDNDDDHDENDAQAPIVSKTVRDREHAQQQKDKKMSLLCKAAEMYKGRPVSLKNVALESHLIRRHGENTVRAKNASMLEVSIVVFGPESDYNDSSDDESANNKHNHSQSISNPRMKSATLQLVRMVNGIPLLDSPEAVACGLVQKISNNASNWNSFGLDVSLKKSIDSPEHSEDEILMLEVEDSAQVAPFFRESTHGLFHSRQEYDSSQSSDDESACPDNITRKRKKEKNGLLSLLPASLRLGEMMMIVHIQAKPSALPLPTLSKGRLPLNDKAINDALENGITSCLRNLQRTNPSLLLTAHQLKRVERDSKYVPAVAGAIASVLGRSKEVGLYERAVNIMSGWDEEVKRLGIPPFDQDIGPDPRAITRNIGQATNPHASAHERELGMVEILRPMLERRLRFAVSEEFKDAKREKGRKERENEAAARKKEKADQSRAQKQTDKSDDMYSDCFESDHSVELGIVSRPLKNLPPDHSDFESLMSSPGKCSSQQRKIDKKKSVEMGASDEASHSHRLGNQQSLAGSVPAVIFSPAKFACNDGFDSDDEENNVATNNFSNDICKSDCVSSDDDWSEQYGMVVPGRFFR